MIFTRHIRSRRSAATPAPRMKRRAPAQAATGTSHRSGSRSGHDFSRLRVQSESETATPARTVTGRTHAPMRGAGETDVLGEEVETQTPEVPGGAEAPVELDDSAQKKQDDSTIIKATERRSYTVSGKTLKEAADSIEAREEAGLAEWPTKASYALGEDGRVTKATITISPRITMPNWPGYKNLSAAAKGEWDRFYRALESHEQGHIDLMKRELANIGSTLVGKTEAEANAALQEALDALQTKSDDYDTKTDHGRKTGTIIDTSIE